ncbi:MAG: ATP-binding cassette domain-containing protein [Flavobacteriales bacterium]
MATENKSNALKRLFRLIKSEKINIKNIFFFAIFSGIINLSLPLGIQAIINFLNAGQLSTSWVILVAVVLGGVAFVGLLQIKQLAITETIEQKIFAKAALDFSFRLPRIKQTAVQNKYVPELVNRFFEIMTVQKGLSKILIDFSAATLQIIFGMILLSFYHPLFIVLGAALILLTICHLLLLTGPIGLRTSLKNRLYKFKVAHWLEEIGRAMTTFKLIGNSPLPVEKTDELVTGYLKSRKKHFRILVWQFSGMVIFKVLVAAGLIIMGSILVIDRQINIGQFVASEIIIVLILGAVEKLILNMDTFYDLLTALEKVGTVTDLPLESDEGQDLGSTECEKGVQISFNNVTFQYPDGHYPVIRHLTFDIAAGESVCFTGPEGEGKTTALKLLAGLFDNFEGSISYNGLPIRSIRLDSLRSLFGDNLNESHIFKGTIEENISAGVASVSQKDIKWACELVELDEYIATSEMGFQTNIDPEGTRLPSTIVKKILMARALAKKPKVLLIEDNGLHGNEEFRYQFYRSILDKKNGWTVIIISNDRDVVNMCDSKISFPTDLIY